MPQLAAAATPHACCLFAAIHCEKPFISIRDSIHLTFMIESETHVHQVLGRSEIFRLVTLEQHNGKVLYKLEEDMLLHLLTKSSLKKNNIYVGTSHAG